MKFKVAVIISTIFAVSTQLSTVNRILVGSDWSAIKEEAQNFITREENYQSATTGRPRVEQDQRHLDRTTLRSVAVDKVAEATIAVKVFVAETIYDVSNVIEKFARGAYRTGSAFAGDTLQLLESLQLNIEDAIKEIATKILEIDDELVKEFFENVKANLERFKTVLMSLLNDTDAEFEKALNHANNTLMSISGDLDEWSSSIKTRLRTVKDDAVYKKGCDFIDNFVGSSIEEVYQCCNIVIKPIKSICKSAKDIIGDALSILVDFVEKVEICVLEKKARIPVMIACLDDAFDKVSELMKHASELKDSLFKTLPSKIMISNFCISIAAVEVEVRKIDIDNEIDQKYLT